MSSPTLESYDKIKKLIDSSRFNEAFLLLKNKMKKFPAMTREIEKLKESEKNYKYFLDYLADGNIDPSINDMLINLKETLTEANNILFREDKLTDSPDIYSSTRRIHALRNNTFEALFEIFKNSLEEDRKKETPVMSFTQINALNEVFDYVWTLGKPTQEDIEAINSALTADEIPDYFKTSVISALILGNTTFFNADTFDILLNVQESTDSPEIKAKALTGILIISLLHPARVSANLKLKSRLLLLSEDEEFKKITNELIFDIIRTFDTNRIDNKMRNEVIPGLMKIKPEIIDKIKNISADSEEFLSDMNPNWEEILENSEIGDKIQEINDMQMEGADVMVTAFSSLKSFPFFYNPSNWFLTFNAENEEFGKLRLNNNPELFSRLSLLMCDSDIHSFLLSLNSMPEDRKNQMVANMEAQLKQAQEVLEGEIGESQPKSVKKYIRHSLQDLYRFFKFFRKKDDFNDPFKKAFTDKEISFLVPFFGITPEMVKRIAEFYFKNKYYEEAAGMFMLYDRLSPGDFSVWEKTGYSYQALKKFNEAAEWYGKSILVNPENPWLVKNYAIVLKNSGKSRDAVEYYEQALKEEPENYHLLMSYAQCLIDLGKYEEAKKHLFHAQYIKPDKNDVSRALAWTELEAGNPQKADEHFKKILSTSKANKSDYLNAAHCSLALGDFRRALQLYRAFVEQSENRDITNLVLAFRDDAEIIKKLNIENSSLRLIIDKIRYDILS